MKYASFIQIWECSYILLFIFGGMKIPGNDLGSEKSEECVRAFAKNPCIGLNCTNCCYILSQNHRI